MEEKAKNRARNQRNQLQILRYQDLGSLKVDDSGRALPSVLSPASSDVKTDSVTKTSGFFGLGLKTPTKGW